MLQRRMPGRLMGSVPLWGGGLGAFKFDPALVTFTPGMAKRTSAGPFETAPIVQGKRDSTEVGDTIAYSRGAQIVNDFYANLDSYQGCASFWVTPEWDGNDGKSHRFNLLGASFRMAKNASSELEFYLSGGDFVVIDVSAWTAGTTYHIVFSWDAKNTLDGTNYARISINNVHTFGMTSQPSPPSPGATQRFGHTAGPDSICADAIIEGYTIYRRPLFDGTYGVAANWDENGPIDEIEFIYNAGAGADPCLLDGSWDKPFCLPTDSTAGAIVTGNGEAWSHPHSSGVLKHQWLEDGGYLGRPWAVAFNAINTDINCGSGVTLDDISAAVFTAEAWVRADDYGEGGTGVIINKGRVTSGGWRFMLQESSTALTAEIDFATTNASSRIPFTPDGKCHHFTLYFDQGGDDKLYIAIDGKWASSYDSQVAAIGAHVTDAADDLTLGARDDNALTLEGILGWVAISDNDRYSHGTDFIPPRQPPAPDVNHVEMWYLDEGTGATAAAQVTSPANDGTISNGTWEEQWDIETTPIVPYTLEDSNSSLSVDCGSAADIDDLPSSTDMTIEIWIRVDGDSSQYCGFAGKGADQNSGWIIGMASNHRLFVRFNYDGSDAQHLSAAVFGESVKKWVHVAIVWDTGTKTFDLYLDGIFVSSSTAVGNYIADNAANMIVCDTNDATYDSIYGAMGWFRLSDNKRYSDEFTPPSRLNPPASDGNTLRQFNFRDGAGTTLTDDTATANGTITFGDGQWRITPDMEIDSPGERIFNWGYVIGNDAVDEGITQILSGLDAGENYVVRAVAHVESASRGRPKIIIYDETNGAEITALEGPSFTGVHDGLANAADLTDTTARFPQMLVGWTIYNITDGSSATVTAVSGDMQDIIGALSGGTDDDWDIGDEYRIVPPGGPSEYDDYPWIETFTFELPTIARNGAAADCVSISLKLVNGVNEGVIKWHQVELLENLLDNPSLETGAGNPWIPDGWVNANLDAGDTVQELATVHSGAGSMEWNAGAVTGEYIYDGSAVFTAGKFYSIGMWQYGDGAGKISLNSFTAARGLLQYSTTLNSLPGDIAQNWQPVLGVWRSLGASLDPRLQPDSAGAGDRFTDDIYCVELDDVSLTVTPASEVNSEENGGLRLDGLDFMPQPIPAGLLTATSGWIKFKYTPRHDAADALDFGNLLPVISTYWANAGNYIFVRYNAAASVNLRIRVGAITTNGFWAGATLNAGTKYLFEIKYNATEIILKVDGITQITVTPGAGIDFGANIPNNTYWGTDDSGALQADAVFSAP